jgi:hypothetical protein
VSHLNRFSDGHILFRIFKQIVVIRFNRILLTGFRIILTGYRIGLNGGRAGAKIDLLLFLSLKPGIAFFRNF